MGAPTPQYTRSIWDEPLTLEKVTEALSRDFPGSTPARIGRALEYAKHHRAMKQEDVLAESSRYLLASVQ